MPDSTKEPLTTVIMPVLNQERFLQDAINSLCTQDYTNLEIIIVDDGSTDSTPEIIDRFAQQTRPDLAIRIIRHSTTKGVSAAKNAGLRMAKGTYIAIAAGDDVQKPNRISLPVSILQANPACDIVFLDCEMIDAEGFSLKRSKGYPEDMTGENAILFQLRRNHLFSGLFLARAEACPKFNESLHSGVDYQWAWQVLLAESIIQIRRESVMKYRIHEKNLSTNAARSGESVRQIMQNLDLGKVEAMVRQKFSADIIEVSLAWASLAAEKPEQALGFIEKVPKDSKVWRLEGLFASGVAWFKLKKYAKSEKYFSSLVQNDVMDAAAYNNLAVVLSMQGEKGDNIAKLLSRAMRLRPEYRDASDNLEKVSNGESSNLRFTARPLRKSSVHDKYYQL